MVRDDFFFFNDTATTEIYTLSLHDALPICGNMFLAGATILPVILENLTDWLYSKTFYNKKCKICFRL